MWNWDCLAQQVWRSKHKSQDTRVLLHLAHQCWSIGAQALHLTPLISSDTQALCGSFIWALYGTIIYWALYGTIIQLCRFYRCYSISFLPGKDEIGYTVFCPGSAIRVWLHLYLVPGYILMMLRVVCFSSQDIGYWDLRSRRFGKLQYLWLYSGSCSSILCVPQTPHDE